MPKVLSLLRENGGSVGKRWQHALLWHNDRRKMNLELDVIKLHAVLRSREKGKQWKKARRLLQELLHHLLMPSVVCWSATISACEKCMQ